MTVKRAMNSLPPELVDNTLDFLYDDVLALIQCSQVCKSWVTTSRYHLWGMRILHFAAGFDAATDRLIGLLSHPLSTLALAGPRSVSLGSIAQQRDLMSLMRKLAPCAPVLQATRSLYLRAIIWTDMDDRGRTLLLSNFSSLTELVFSNIRFGTFEDMANVLASFPSLQRLYFLRVQCHGRTPNGSGDSASLILPELTTLEVDYGCPDIIEWLRLSGGNILPRLSTFHLKQSDIIPACDGFSPVFAPSLEHVEVAFYRLHLESLRHLNFDLSPNQALRSIHISHLQLSELGLSSVDLAPLRVHVGWVPRLLASVASSAVEMLRFSICVSAVSEIDLFDWQALRDIFMRSQFSALHAMYLDLTGKMYAKADRVEVEKRIRDGLAGCRAAELLEFRWN